MWSLPTFENFIKDPAGSFRTEDPAKYNISEQARLLEGVADRVAASYSEMLEDHKAKVFTACGPSLLTATSEQDEETVDKPSAGKGVAQPDVPQRCADSGGMMPVPGDDQEEAQSYKSCCDQHDVPTSPDYGVSEVSDPISPGPPGPYQAVADYTEPPRKHRLWSRIAFYPRGYDPLATTQVYPEGDITADPYNQGWKDAKWVAQYGQSCYTPWTEIMSHVLEWFMDNDSVGDEAIIAARVRMAVWLRTHFRNPPEDPNIYMVNWQIEVSEVMACMPTDARPVPPVGPTASVRH